MKKIILPFIFALAVSTPAAAQKTPAKATTATAKSQISVQSVIDNYFAALGGKAKLEAVKTLILDNSITVQGMDIQSTTKKMGNKFKSVQSVMGQEMSQIFDGEKGVMNQMGQKMDLPAETLPELKKSVTMDALAYKAENFSTATTEQLDGKTYNVLTSEKGKFFFDAATGLLFKSETQQGSATIKSYLTVDGIKFPELLEAEGGGQTMTIKTTKVTINSGVTDEDFKI